MAGTCKECTFSFLPIFVFLLYILLSLMAHNSGEPLNSRECTAEKQNTAFAFEKLILWSISAGNFVIMFVMIWESFTTSQNKAVKTK